MHLCIPPFRSFSGPHPEFCAALLEHLLTLVVLQGLVVSWRPSSMSSMFGPCMLAVLFNSIRSGAAGEETLLMTSILWMRQKMCAFLLLCSIASRHD